MTRRKSDVAATVILPRGHRFVPATAPRLPLACYLALDDALTGGARFPEDPHSAASPRRRDRPSRPPIKGITALGSKEIDRFLTSDTPDITSHIITPGASRPSNHPSPRG